MPRSSFSGNICFGFSVLCRQCRKSKIWETSTFVISQLTKILDFRQNDLCDFHLRTYLCSGFLLFGADLYIIQFTRTWRRRADFRRWRGEMWRTRDRQLRRRGAAKWAVSRRRHLQNKRLAAGEVGSVVVVINSRGFLPVNEKTMYVMGNF